MKLEQTEEGINFDEDNSNDIGVQPEDHALL